MKKFHLVISVFSLILAIISLIHGYVDRSIAITAVGLACVALY